MHSHRTEAANSMIRSYSELEQFDSFLDRYKYLKLNGGVGVETFGFDRYVNQAFYRSKTWRDARAEVINRDGGCDLGDPDFPIYGRILVHHMNPIQLIELEEFSADILDPEFLICVSHGTHNAIHYGDESLLPLAPPERKPNDTIPWL